MTSRKSILASATALTLGLLAVTAASAADFGAQPNLPRPSAANCDCPMMKGAPVMDEKAMPAQSPASGQRAHPGGTGSR